MAHQWRWVAAYGQADRGSLVALEGLPLELEVRPHGDGYRAVWRLQGSGRVLTWARVARA